MLEEADDGDLFDGVESSVVAECLDEFKNFYTSRCVCLRVCVYSWWGGVGSLRVL